MVRWNGVNLVLKRLIFPHSFVMSVNSSFLRGICGTLVFASVAQFLLAMTASEELYPYVNHVGYSVSLNYISDLGVGGTAVIFNTSIVILGLSVIVSAYLVYSLFGSRSLLVTLFLAGIGATGVGTFPETHPLFHTIFSLITFLFAGLSAVLSYRVVSRWFGVFSVFLGLLSLVSLALYIRGSYLNLGTGGMERMVVYPVLFWALGFGGYLMGRPPPARAADRVGIS